MTHSTHSGNVYEVAYKSADVDIKSTMTKERMHDIMSMSLYTDIKIFANANNDAIPQSLYMIFLMLILLVFVLICWNNGRLFHRWRVVS